MKKIISLLILGCLLFSSIQEMSGQWTTQGLLDSLFSNFKPDHVPGGTLADKSFQVVPFQGYQYINDSDITIQHWKQMALQISYMSLTKGFIPSQDSIEKLMDKALVNGVIPVMMLHWKYGTLDPKAFDKGLIDTMHGKPAYIRGFDPFVAQSVFAAVPSLPTTLGGGTARFVFHSSYYFSNIPMSGHLVFDAGDGGGFRTVNWGDTVNVTYTDTLPHQIFIQLVDDHGTILTESRSWFKNNYFTKPPYQMSTAMISGNIPYLLDDVLNVRYASRWDPGSGEWQKDVPEVIYDRSPFAQGQITYLRPMGSQPGCFKKPLIFVEGIDFGQDGYPRLYCDTATGKCGSLGLIDILNARLWAPGSANHLKALPVFEEGPMLMDSLMKLGYEIIYLDFQDGATYMQRNAFVLISLIQKIQAEICSQEEIVVVGASMGGQLVRYALSYMEKNLMPHCVREVVLFDSPNQGANIPIGYQVLLKKYGLENEVLFQAAVKAYATKLNRPATRQLLIHHCDAVDFGITQSRQDFLSELKALGNYPSQSRKVAVINGSGSGVHLPFSAGDSLVKLNLPLGTLTGGIIGTSLGVFVSSFVGYSPWIIAAGTSGGVTLGQNFDFLGKAYALNGKNHGKGPMIMDAEKNGFGKVGIVPPPFNSKAIDHIPGGTTQVLGSSAFSLYFNQLDDDFIRFGMNIMHAYQSTSSFIPTYSALDLYNNDPQFIPLQSLPATEPYPAQYPLDAWHGPNGDNESHVSIRKHNSFWMLKEIENSRPELNQLPFVSSGLIYPTYNYCKHPQNVIGNCEVNSQCSLLVNAPLPGGLGNLPAPIAGSYFYVRTRNCGSQITIKDGAVLQLGGLNQPVSNRGILQINQGSVLTMEPNSTLMVYSGSRLEINKNGILDLYADVQIYLEEGAELALRGKLLLRPGASLRIMGSGKVVFGMEDKGFICMGHNTLLLQDMNVAIEQDLSLNDLDSSNFIHCQVSSGENVYIFNGALYSQIQDNVFQSAESGRRWGGWVQDAAYSSRFLQFTGNIVYHAETGLKLEQTNLPEMEISFNQFLDGGTGIYSEIGLSHLSNCLFKNLSKGLETHQYDSVSISNCQWLKNDTSIWIESDYLGNVYIEKCHIRQSVIPLFAMGINQHQLTQIAFKCCYFGHSGSIQIQDMELNISTQHEWVSGSQKYGGYNVFYQTPIMFSLATGFHLREGQNDFMCNANWIKNYMSGLLWGNQDSVILDGNYFVGENGNYFNHAPDGCSLSRFDAMGQWGLLNWKGQILNYPQGGCSNNQQEPLKPLPISLEISSEKTYPNPVIQGDNFTFRANECGILRLFNLQGIMLQEINTFQDVNYISTKDLSPGIYILEWYSKEKMRRFKSKVEVLSY